MGYPASQHYRVTHLWMVLGQRERTVEWLANKVGYSGQYLRLIRAGKRPVTEEVARRIAAFLELPVESLFVPIVSTKVDNIAREEAVA